MRRSKQSSSSSSSSSSSIPPPQQWSTNTNNFFSAFCWWQPKHDAISSYSVDDFVTKLRVDEIKSILKEYGVKVGSASSSNGAGPTKRDLAVRLHRFFQDGVKDYTSSSSVSERSGRKERSGRSQQQAAIATSTSMTARTSSSSSSSLLQQQQQQQQQQIESRWSSIRKRQRSAQQQDRIERSDEDKEDQPTGVDSDANNNNVRVADDDDADRRSRLRRRRRAVFTQSYSQQQYLAAAGSSSSSFSSWKKRCINEWQLSEPEIDDGSSPGDWRIYFSERKEIEESTAGDIDDKFSKAYKEIISNSLANISTLSLDLRKSLLRACYITDAFINVPSDAYEADDRMVLTSNSHAIEIQARMYSPCVSTRFLELHFSFQERNRLDSTFPLAELNVQFKSYANASVIPGVVQQHQQNNKNNNRSSADTTTEEAPTATDIVDIAGDHNEYFEDACIFSMRYSDQQNRIVNESISSERLNELQDFLFGITTAPTSPPATTAAVTTAATTAATTATNTTTSDTAATATVTTTVTTSPYKSKPEEKKTPVVSVSQQRPLSERELIHLILAASGVIAAKRLYSRWMQIDLKWLNRRQR